MSQKRKSLYNKMVDISKGDEWYKYCVPFDNHPIMDFPLRIPKGYNMYDYLKIIFDKYYKLLEKVEAYEVKSEAKQLGNAILKSLRVYYHGNTIAAYKKLKRVLKKVLDFNTEETIILKDAIEGNVHFYRMRKEDNHTLETSFYHTPFNMRYFCSTQRFTVPGYPALYVAYSKSCCMVEMEGYHSLGEFQYKGNGKVNILDLTMNPPIDGKNAGKHIPEKIFLKYWPLIAACYVVNTVPEGIDKRNASFREEYIIPQFLSLYVKEHLIYKKDNSIENQRETEEKTENKTENQREIWGIRYYTVNKEDLDPCGTGENDYRNIMFFTEYDEDSPTPYDMELMGNFEFKGSYKV